MMSILSAIPLWLQLVALLLLAAVAALSYVTRQVQTTIPGPKRHWIVGNFPQMAKHGPPVSTLPLYLEEEHATHGPIFSVQMPPSLLIVVVGKPGPVREILRKPKKFSLDRRFCAAFGSVCEGLLVLEGPKWKRHRGALRHTFEPNQLAQVVPASNAQMDALVAEWSKTECSNIPMHKHFSNATKGVIGRVGFDVDMDFNTEVGHRVSEAVEGIQGGVIKRITVPKFLWFLLSTHKKTEACNVVIHDFLKQLLAERRAAAAAGTVKNDRHDVMSLLLTAQERSLKAAADSDEPVLTDDEIVDELIMFFLAGHETSSNCLAWTMGMLCEHPQHMQQLCDEVAAVCGSEPPTHAQLSGLTFTEACIKESLRLHPVAAFTSRLAQEDSTILGHNVPKGAVVFTNFKHCMLDPEYYPQPELYNPHRWTEAGLAEAAAAGRPSPAEAYFPFGFGPKRCIGLNFAMLEMKTMLARVAQFMAAKSAAAGGATCTMRRTPGQGPMVMESTLTVKPRNGVFVDFVMS